MVDPRSGVMERPEERTSASRRRANDKAPSERSEVVSDRRERAKTSFAAGPPPPNFLVLKPKYFGRESSFRISSFASLTIFAEGEKGPKWSLTTSLRSDDFKTKIFQTQLEFAFGKPVDLWSTRVLAPKVGTDVPPTLPFAKS